MSKLFRPRPTPQPVPVPKAPPVPEVTPISVREQRVGQRVTGAGYTTGRAAEDLGMPGRRGRGGLTG